MCRLAHVRRWRGQRVTHFGVDHKVILAIARSIAKRAHYGGMRTVETQHGYENSPDLCIDVVARSSGRSQAARSVCVGGVSREASSSNRSVPSKRRWVPVSSRIRRPKHEH